MKIYDQKDVQGIGGVLALSSIVIDNILDVVGGFWYLFIGTKNALASRIGTMSMLDRTRKSTLLRPETFFCHMPSIFIGHSGSINSINRAILLANL